MQRHLTFSAVLDMVTKPTKAYKRIRVTMSNERDAWSRVINP